MVVDSFPNGIFAFFKHTVFHTVAFCKFCFCKVVLQLVQNFFFCSSVQAGTIKFCKLTGNTLAHFYCGCG